MVRTEQESDRGKRAEEKWQTCWCCGDQQRACKMAQASSEKLEHTGPAEKKRVVYCYSGYQVFLINLFYLALLVMITFIQVDTSSYRACKKLQYPSTFSGLWSQCHRMVSAKEWSQCLRESSWQVRQSRLC